MDLSDRMQLQARALADPSRFRLFRYIVEAPKPVPVAELTKFLRFNHNAIRQHLAVLADEGLVDTSTEERTTRGRPRKLYTASPDALNAFATVDGPYQRLAALLLEMAESGKTAYEVGRARGEAQVTSKNLDESAAHEDLVRELRAGGFVPRSDPNALTLERCPFADLAGQNQGVVCEIHRGLIDGQLAASGGSLQGNLHPADPTEAGCVVQLSTTATGDHVTH